MRYVLSLMLGVAAVGCGSKTSPTPTPTLTPSPTDSNTTNTTNSNTAPTDYVVDANPQPPLVNPQAISASPNVWTWVPVAQARCGNGNSTGFAVNLVSGSNELLIVYEGGGACWNPITCFDLQSASNLNGYDQTTFETGPEEEQALENDIFITNRQNPNNPFAAMNMAFIPYCTGDVHDGNNVVTYTGVDHPTYHVGFRNAQLYTQLLKLTLPNVNHIWLAGYSAGGFGATFHYADTQAQFPGARIDLLNDSGSSFPGMGQQPVWNIVLPTGCSQCDPNNFGSLVQAFSGANPHSRFGIMSYYQDTTLPLFFSIDEQQFEADLTAYEAVIDTLPNAKYFVVAGQGHVLVDEPQLTAGDANVNITTWVTQMATDDPAWVSQ